MPSGNSRLCVIYSIKKDAVKEWFPIYEMIDWQSMPEDEVEAYLDSFVEALAPEIEAAESKTTLLNPLRQNQLMFVYDTLRWLCRNNPDAKVSYKLYEPFKTMGSVSVEAKDIVILDTRWFIRIAGFADNMDVYPLTNGKVRLTFGFHNLTVPIE